MPPQQARILMAKLKAKGMVTGILDYEFFYRGTLHIMDFKIGTDRLSTEQKEHIRMVENNGGKAHVIATLEEFVSLINQIISQ